MSNKYDKLENEKPDPIESSNYKVLVVPIVMIVLLISFGSAYIAYQTDSTSLYPGDSRTYFDEEAGEAPASKTADANASVDDITSLMKKGENVFAKVCQVCHQATGLGIPGAFPPLAESDFVTGPAKQITAVVLHGLYGKVTVKGQVYNSAMPPFKDQLDSDEVAAVLTYVRNSFGNKASMITSDFVEQVREETKDRTTSWNGDEELHQQTWE